MFRLTSLFVLAAVAAACQSDSSTPPKQNSEHGVDVSTAAGIGEFLTTPSGLSLYVFFSDTQGTPTVDPVSACEDSCVSAWPIFKLSGSLPSQFESADFGSYVRADGVTQSTFRGWPLYTYSSDNAAGDIKGHELGTWSLALTDLDWDGSNEEEPIDETDEDVTDEDESPTDEDEEPVLAVTVRTSDTLGDYLADANGKTLYVFLNDTQASGGYDPTSACTGGCLANWPVFTISGSLDAELDASDFDSYVRADSATQATFAGWPLYKYVGDEAAGDTNGHNLGQWRVAQLSLAE